MRQLLEIESIPLILEYKTTYPRWERKDIGDVRTTSAYNDRLNQVANEQNMAALSPVGSTDQVGHIHSDTRNPYIEDVYDGSPQFPSYSQAVSYQSVAKSFMNNDDMGVPKSGFLQAGIQNRMISMEAERSPVKPLSHVYVGKHVSPTEMDLSLRSYSSERAGFDARQSMVCKGFEFVPGSVECTVAQWNEVKITYVGNPIYVPRSADPNYEEPEYM